MTRNALIFILSLLCYLSSAQEIESYSIVNLELSHKTDINILLDLGIAADHVHFDHPNLVELFISQKEKNILIDNGFVMEDLIPDTKLYADKLSKIRKSKPLKSNECGLESYQLGSVGGYHDYEEVIAILDKINADFPQITALDNIGKSYEGRDIIALKISDNPNEDESATEPAAYYDALTHAREPLSMMSTLYYIRWLLENYNNPNETAKYYIDNREMYFVLVVNPDGYVYNTETAPAGGGGWRKNRRTINNECIGVDINRNYNAQWEGPGSHSINPCSDLYRGETPNSEVETRAVQDYIDKIRPKSAFSSHSYSQVIIDPNKKAGNANYSFEQYASYASEFTPSEYFGYGSADDLIGYLASGTTLDYLLESGTVAWTPEIGTRFWEPQEDICGYVQEMLEPMKFISKIAGEAPSYHNHYILNDGGLINGNTVELSIEITNKGITNTQQNVIAELIPLSTEVTIQNNSIMYLPPDDGEGLYEQIDNFNLEIGEIEIGTPLLFELRILQDGVLAESKEITIYPGDFSELFNDDFESSLNNWTQSSNGENWSITDIDHKSGNQCLIDSKLSYASGTVSVIQLTNPIPLTENSEPWLFFNIKYGLDPSSAQLRVLLSDDAINWRAIKTDGMRLVGRDNSFTGHNYWQQEAVDLKDYVDNYSELYIRYELTAQDFYRASDGVYIDDVRVMDYAASDSTSPTSELITTHEIKIYPNPTSGQLHIAPLNIPTQQIKVKIYNGLGQEVMSAIDLNSAVGGVLETNAFLPGLYIIQFEIGNRRLNKKIIKNRY